MRTLEKDRSRRYSAPSDLAADIRRHLAHEPVTAGPPGVAYRTRKFLRRHRVAVTVVGVVALALVAGLAAATLGLIEARRANTRAEREAATAEEVSEFLVGLFEVSDPGEARGNTVTAREVLDTGVERIAGELSGEPRVRAKMLATMGRVYSKLGLSGDAVPLLEEAYALETELGAEVEGRTGQHLAWVYLQRGRYDDAERVYRGYSRKTSGRAWRGASRDRMGHAGPGQPPSDSTAPRRGGEISRPRRWRSTNENWAGIIFKRSESSGTCLRCTRRRGATKRHCSSRRNAWKACVAISVPTTSIR